MYIYDFFLIKIKCFYGVELTLIVESEEKPKVVIQIAYRVKSDAQDPLNDIRPNGFPEDKYVDEGEKLPEIKSSYSRTS